LSVIAVLAAAAVVGTFASPAFAGAFAVQINKQEQKISGFGVTIGVQAASNCIGVNNGANSCRIGGG
jgi:hypothetical protein